MSAAFEQFGLLVLFTISSWIMIVITLVHLLTAIRTTNKSLSLNALRSPNLRIVVTVALLGCCLCFHTNRPLLIRSSCTSMLVDDYVDVVTTRSSSSAAATAISSSNNVDSHFYRHKRVRQTICTTLLLDNVNSTLPRYISNFIDSTISFLFINNIMSIFLIVILFSNNSKERATRV